MNPINLEHIALCLMVVSSLYVWKKKKGEKSRGKKKSFMTLEKHKEEIKLRPQRTWGGNLKLQEFILAPTWSIFTYVWLFSILWKVILVKSWTHLKPLE